MVRWSTKSLVVHWLAEWRVYGGHLMAARPSASDSTLRVLADNPATTDYLGLQVVAQAVTDVVCADNSEPITVGLHGPWGSGKSSLLAQIRSNLKLANRTLVVEVNPWEFGPQEDVKGTIIATVLDALIQNTESGKADKLKNLVKRISWSRAAAAVASGALTMSWNIDQLAEALTPRPESGPPTTLAGFRDEFADAMSDVTQHRVVLLIDDLDRCLPSATLATLEAVKLFLAVPKMAFVVAADQTMVREAIAVGLGESRRGEAFARDYLDKIVQVPVPLPQPTPHDAECYVAILLAERTHDAAPIEVLIHHAEQRRAAGSTPYLLGLADDVLAPAFLEQAKSIVAGLGSDDLVNPRRMKRFVNALAVRQHTATASGVELDPAVIAKLFMLEHRFHGHLRMLAEVNQVDRRALLEGWEGWALDREGSSAPDDADDELKRMLAASPLLAEQDTEQYFVLARKLLNARFSEGLGEEAAECLNLLLHDDLGPQERGATLFGEGNEEIKRVVVDELVAQAGMQADPAPQVRAMLRIADAAPDAAVIAEAVRARRETLTAGNAHLLRQTTEPTLLALATELNADELVPDLARRALAEGGA